MLPGNKLTPIKLRKNSRDTLWSYTKMHIKSTPPANTNLWADNKLPAVNRKKNKKWVDWIA